MALPTTPLVNTGNLGSVPSIYFDKVAVDALHSNLSLYGALDLKNIPLNSGGVLQIYANSALAANTTSATEGTMGAGVAFTQPTKQITLSQFVDYITFSDKVVSLGLPGLIEDGATELGFRGALTVDSIISAALDVAATSDSVANMDNADVVYFTAATSRKAGAKLRALGIKPKASGKYLGIMPSLLAFDLKNDNTAGGFMDMLKYTERNAGALQEGTGSQYLIGTIDGVEWFESNALPFDVNYTPSGGSATGKNGWHSYVIGAQAIFGASLFSTALGPKNFQVTVSKYNQSNPIDVAIQTRAAVWYNFLFGVSMRPGTVNGFKRVRSESTLG